ncbi:CTP synthase [Pseudomonadota bacterium]
MATRFIFITGGVVSSLGKGIASASLAALLQARGYKVRIRKLDPYLNVDPGTMSPTQHGEVFVTDDGAETDLDLGHYERFTGENAKKTDNITTGQIYSTILTKERRGDYLGGTVQVIPHVTGLIKEFILNDLSGVDFAICEIGGTVGDIEGLPYFESIRQLGFEFGKERTAFVHLTLLPYIETAQELKTKPTQHSVKELRSIGINPNFLLCRSDREIPENQLEKISIFCNTKRKRVIPALNAKTIYGVPLLYHKYGFDTQILKYFKLPYEKEPDLRKWKKIVDSIKNPEGEITIGIVGKYISNKDAYKSLDEALIHAGIVFNKKVNTKWIDARKIRGAKDLKPLRYVDGILVPGGFGRDGTEGKILAVKYARENNIPYLGICFGMQMAVIEFARNVLGLKNANSTEFEKTKHPVIGLITEWMRDGAIEKRTEKSNLGGTMRLGAYKAVLKKGSLLNKIYGEGKISERHRHRYEVNTNYIEDFEKHGLIFSGMSPDGKLPETVELKNHPFFIGVQYHPEFKSRPFDPSPIFKAFVKATVKNSNLV